MSEFRGTEGARPYARAGWYYAEYRDHVGREFIALLAERLGWTAIDRVLDLGAGPGQLSLLVAPFVAEVVAVEPEPDMLAEGKRRAGALGAANVRFIAASSDDLRVLRPSLGRFRTALMGRSCHWMPEQDRLLRDRGAMIDEADGSVAIVRPRSITVPDALAAARKAVRETLERYIADVPRGPHPDRRRDLSREILARSPFPAVEALERIYAATVRPSVESLIGREYTRSYVLTRLGDRRESFEREVRTVLGDLGEIGEVVVTRRDEALIGRRSLALVHNALQT